MTVRIAINGSGRNVLRAIANEWGFSCRMCDTAVAMVKLL